MRYIRTEDGRIMEIHLEEMSLPTTIGVHTEECVEGEYIGVEVIKVADTIEELCDIGVLDEILGTLGRDTFWNEHFTISKEQIIKNKQTLYGAIWTDKGLIYVAKMNNEGELKLL